MVARNFIIFHFLNAYSKKISAAFGSLLNFVNFGLLILNWCRRIKSQYHNYFLKLSTRFRCDRIQGRVCWTKSD